MASSESAPPPGSGDVNPPPTASQAAQPTPGVEQAKAEQPKEVSPKSVFVNSEPIREDQVQNAIKFLSHPKVRGSLVIHRRNFLERKGLTKDEIDEAFRRVPDPSPSMTTGQSTSTGVDGQFKPSSTSQQNVAQTIQLVANPPSRVAWIFPRRFHWSHAVLAIGILAASGAGTVVIFKKTIIPRFKSWIRGVISNEEHADPKTIPIKPSLEEEVAAAAKAAAAAAAEVARTSREMLIVQSKGNRRLEEFINLFNSQVQETKSMRTSTVNLEAKRHNTERSLHVEGEYQNGTYYRSKEPTSNDGAEFDSRSVRSTSPPVPAEPPHPKSYMEIMAMVQRGERPPNVRDIDDSPPNPNQPISNPSLAPRAKPWETTQRSNYTSFASQSPHTIERSSSMNQATSSSTHQWNNDEASTAQWQQKNSRFTEIDQRENGAGRTDWPPQRKWVPPQPPPVVMPEAAVAIRQLKSTAPKDPKLPADDNGVDELQRVTRESESGRQVEINNAGGSEINSGEIQEELVGS